MSVPEHLIRDLPDPIAVGQFADRFAHDHPSRFRLLSRNSALLSDVLTLAAYSPLLAATLLQNPDHVAWLDRRRKDKGIRGKEELLESLARFALTNSQLDHQVMLARFRRRELLRIYLADIRRQLGIAEITEELSNLADAILEFALRLVRQELDNRHGPPFEIDEKGREVRSGSCIVSLGKLGSRELNYSSDIDLLFLYSAEGTTSGLGSRGKVTNREYFVKLAELVAKMIGQQTGEGATYRVDLRLRPHGRVGPLAMSVRDTALYYKNEAADWERQVLIRSRASAGESDLFADFYARTESRIFSRSQSVSSALRSVKRSKQKIDIEHNAEKGYDVKLGRGGIREIEFVAQALQLAYGGRDPWLRASHTLISLSRLTDRGLISKLEQSALFEAYEFLRRLEHILQMENGLQTHLVPGDPVRRTLVARRMRFDDTAAFDRALELHSANVHRVFRRVFSDENIRSSERDAGGPADGGESRGSPLPAAEPEEQTFADGRLDLLRSASQAFATLLRSTPDLPEAIPFEPPDFLKCLKAAANEGIDLRSKLSSIRREWHRQLIAIAALDMAGDIDIRESKRRQTLLAEASIELALAMARDELAARYGTGPEPFALAVMGVGKLGGAGVDYGSDLDLVLVFDETQKADTGGITAMEYYSRAADLFVNVLSGYTRDGNLYRVDLRLRPHGKNGPNVISRSSFAAYFAETAAIWELLAFVKLRGAGGGPLSADIENEVSAVVHERASRIEAAELAAETRRVRELLEAERTDRRRSEVNIKYGAGGMLDIYFAIRFLQLRDNVPDAQDDRSSEAMLGRLRESGSVTSGQFDAMRSGYLFLSPLDHAMRLTIGRSHVVPHADHPAMLHILERVGIASASELLEQLTLQRFAVREAFDEITK